MTYCPYRKWVGAHSEILGGSYKPGMQGRIQRRQPGTARRRERYATTSSKAANVPAPLAGGREANIVSVGTLQEH